MKLCEWKTYKIPAMMTLNIGSWDLVESAWPLGKRSLETPDLEEHFEFISVLYEAVGVPDGKVQEFSHYVSLERVERRFSIDPDWSKRSFIIVLSS
jgi:hypothetical protein